MCSNTDTSYNRIICKEQESMLLLIGEYSSYLIESLLSSRWMMVTTNAQRWLEE